MEKELRQPLDIINKYANAILSGETGPTTEDLNKYNTIISKQTSRILNLTSDLTNLAQFETSKTKIEKSKVNLSSVIDNVFDEMLAQAAPKNNKLIKEVDAQLPEVTANANNILQVIINLISNAIKFSPDNGLIKISAQKDGEGLIVVEVKDQGLGIEKKDLEKVFEKFYSVSSETARVKSTGLGLALCKTIIEAHGGRIWAESEGKGKGSSFKFTLPIN
ncbi:MAG: HAMP domain-containing histidine kinase [Candidatus Margulisbacteria bacterium]|nr:HAMP domain-containing histidine kinase [Candidatus Margulisiibacteriota bacterium]